MGRHFTGASGDYIDLGPGNAANVDGGPGTIVVLWRPTTVHEGWLIDAENGAGGHAFSVNPYSDGLLWHTMVGFRTTMAYTALDGWRLDLWTKAAGTAQVRGHTILLSGGGWSHADYGTSADSPNVPTTHIRVGRHFTMSGALNGDVAAMAVVGAEWSDGAIEAGGLTTGLAEWMTLIGADPAVVWAFNQADVGDPVTDVTGGGGDQLAISGTAVGADPPGFSYLLSTPTDCAFAADLPALGVAFTAAPSSMSAFAADLPALGVAFTAAPSSMSVLAADLPALDAHLSNIPPPLMTGTAVVRALTGTATAT
jgi:hypothetical protein